jgi:hypothetical protein
MHMNAKKPRAPRHPKLPSHGSQTIGYASPPQAHQFKKGQSGNPQGRPKGLKTEGAILRELLNEKVDIGQGRKKRVTAFEAILRGFVEEALKGDKKSASFVFNRYAATQGGDTQASADPYEDNLEAISDFVRRFKATNPRARGK